ncbi:DsrE family protein [Aequorivita sp. F47161]|uniref:DsrE family protein n=1 Tax=Aequorivita vitellina TaxID=2874475 RepID=A0A9X1QWE8_9FLAO|nr:DsrE family protein [Aequorivita vitellina]MCG2420173.1 DsrE family protein [Aequorivita vitellina]
MKKYIQILIVLLSLSATAQQTAKPKDFVVLTSKLEQLKPILLAADNLPDKENFQIVMYGPNAADLLKTETKEYINWATNSDVKISVCKMSLDKLQIDPKTLPKQIEVVENAFLTAFQLQKAGYKLLNL